MSLTVLVADDHPLVREALARMLRAFDAQAQVHEADALPPLLTLVARHDPDLALVDLHMPGMDGIAGVLRLREAAPALPVIVMSGQEDAATIRAVLACGTVGFIPKSGNAQAVVQALRCVRDGGVYVPPQAVPAAPTQASPTGGLTPRQLDVLRGLLRGQPNKLIARDLGLTEGTVKIHVAAILRTLQARNRTEAIVRARGLGIAP